MQSKIHQKPYKVRNDLRVSQATSRPHRKSHKYLKAAQMLFRLLLAVDSPNNNSNRPEPSILNRVFFDSQIACEDI